MFLSTLGLRWSEGLRLMTCEDKRCYENASPKGSNVAVRYELRAFLIAVYTSVDDVSVNSPITLFSGC